MGPLDVGVGDCDDDNVGEGDSVDDIDVVDKLKNDDVVGVIILPSLQHTVVCWIGIVEVITVVVTSG
jgi:hypothetical protein